MERDEAAPEGMPSKIRPCSAGQSCESARALISTAKVGAFVRQSGDIAAVRKRQNGTASHTHRPIPTRKASGCQTISDGFSMLSVEAGAHGAKRGHPRTCPTGPNCRVERNASIVSSLSPARKRAGPRGRSSGVPPSAPLQARCRPPALARSRRRPRHGGGHRTARRGFRGLNGDELRRRCIRRPILPPDWSVCPKSRPTRVAFM